MKSQQWISSFGPGPDGPLAAPHSLSHAAVAAAAAVFAGKIVFGQLDVENPFVLISSALLVQPDEGVSDLVVDRIGVNYRNLPRRAGLL
ncbi:(+)-neomenthol dehydrogenase-like [Dorcoceras hygrometricum]|uniref:(+)-neomenthol dehydrogenase-like n=1 Tax=Dorcoceras hygrometricum TaxID=472368 RepID=A0A2Z7CSA5_9LAMI|nr:(+)-neomenthol dehydrogenase-like [Dorcoceras hygrometricum]